MGKRSNFERVPRDFYPTPIEAMPPLVRFIEPDAKYIEPCAGDGTLIKHMSTLLRGSECIWASDIEPQAPGIEKYDALQLSKLKMTVNKSVTKANYIITNPPWNRKILHPMIEEFIKVAPTWLLFDADWMHTKQAIPYLEHCVCIVSVGRVKWIPESKMTGKDNCCWYFFKQDKRLVSTFHKRIDIQGKI
jgi:hypothetical protein